MALVSVVAPSVAGRVIASEVVAFAGSAPLLDVPPAAADAAAGETIGAGSLPNAATTAPGFAGAVAVVAGGVGAPATTSAVFACAVDEAADDVTTVPVDVNIAPLVAVLSVLVGAVAESVTRSPLADVAVDWTLPAAGAAMSAPWAPPALGSEGPELPIGVGFPADAEPVTAGVTFGVVDAVGAGDGAGATAAGAVLEAESEVVAAALEVDELVVCAGASVEATAWSEEPEFDDASELDDSGAEVLTGDVAAGVSAGVGAAAVVDELDAAVDAWSVTADGVVPEAGVAA